MQAHRENPDLQLLPRRSSILWDLRWKALTLSANSEQRIAGPATPIDSTGTLADGTPIKGPDDLRKALTKQPDQFVQTMTQKLMTYGLGRSVEYFDMPTVRKIVRDSAKDNYKFSSIVLGIVKSPAFQSQRAPESDDR